MFGSSQFSLSRTAVGKVITRGSISSVHFKFELMALPAQNELRGITRQHRVIYIQKPLG